MGTKIFSIALVVAFAALLINTYMKNKGETRYIFQTEWFDPISGTIKKFHLSFFPRDKSVEMYDLRAQRLFLKRIQIESIEERDLYLGNTVVILSRQLKLTDYADANTRNHISSRRQRTFAMVKPDVFHRLGEVIDVIQSRDFEVSQMKMIQLSRSHAAIFYREHEGRPFFEPLLDYVTGGSVVAMELITTDAVKRWRQTLGPTDSALARDEAPESIRAKFGKNKQENAAHGSDSDISATREIEFFFPSSKINGAMVPITTARFVNNTCVIIKPHAISAGNMGGILQAITEGGFDITALEMFRLDKIQAEEFLEVYKGVVNDYPGMVQQLISGPSVALEIQSIHGAETPIKFREFVGPADPDVARELRPNSLRARYGEDKVKNAVHCSDLPDDGSLEVEYFFKILQ